MESNSRWPIFLMACARQHDLLTGCRTRKLRSLCPVNVGKGSETVLLEGMKAAGEAIKSEIVVNLNNAHLTLEIFTKNAPLLNDAATSQKRLNPVNSMGLSVPQQNRPKSFQYTAPVCIGHRSSQDISENMPSAPLVRGK